MKISKIYIDCFGKFKKKEIDLSDGFNLVFGENEMGKTTVMEFIKMMFYGSKKSSDTYANARKRYLPWDDGRMAGSIEFESGGVYYRLDREFRSSNSTDKITLWNLDDGTSENLSGSEDAGARFFGFGSGAFEKSLFIANDPSFSADASADGEINAKLSSLTASFDDETSAEQVLARICSAQNELLTKTGRGGSIFKLENEKNELLSAQRENEELCMRRENIESEIDALRQSLSQINAQRSEYFERLKTAEKSELKGKLEKFIEAAQSYEDTEKKLKNAQGEMINTEFLEAANRKLELLKKYESENISSGEAIISLTDEVSKLSSFDNSSEVQSLEKSKQELFNQYETCEAELRQTEINLLSLQKEKENLKSSPNWLLVIIGAVLTVIGAVCGAVINPLVFAGCAAGAICAVLGFLIKRKPDTAKTEADIVRLKEMREKLLSEKNGVSGKMQEISEKINNASALTGANEKILEEKRKENIRLREKQLESASKIDAVRRELFDILMPYGCKPSTDAAELFLKDAAKSLNDLEIYRVKAEGAAVGTKCTNLESAKSTLALLGDAQSDENSAELKEKMAQANEEKAKIENKLTELTTHAKSAFKDLKTPVEYEREIAEINSQISAQKEYYEKLKTAEQALLKASSLLRRNFSGALENRAAEIFSGITSGRYTDVSISKNFEINLQNDTDFGAHNAQSLSKGTADQAYFSLRLALSEAIGKENGGLPVFLDDVFSQYDDKREAAGFKYLGAYAQKAQIIFFTCHNSARESAEQNGAKIVEL